jgi:hypothetical protein
MLLEVNNRQKCRPPLKKAIYQLKGKRVYKKNCRFEIAEGRIGKRHKGKHARHIEVFCLINFKRRLKFKT